MKSYWITLASIPKDGKDFFSEEQDFWEKSFTDCSLNCKIVDPIVTKIYILPQGEGVLFRGQVAGTVSLPCDRCTEPAVHSFLEKFDVYESLPKEALFLEDEEEMQDSHVIRMAAQGFGVEINPLALAWEEFVLGLPAKPLCTKQCKGLCEVCGINKNVDTCSCTRNNPDPRLAPLHNIKIKNK